MRNGYLKCQSDDWHFFAGKKGYESVSEAASSTHSKSANT